VTSGEWREKDKKRLNAEDTERGTEYAEKIMAVASGEKRQEKHGAGTDNDYSL
jgi:hypothetical protein